MAPPKSTPGKDADHRDMILDIAKNAFPDAISATSVAKHGFAPIANELVRKGLLVKGTFKGKSGYRWPDPTSAARVMSKRRGLSGAAYERDVQEAMKKLRESGSMKRK